MKILSLVVDKSLLKGTVPDSLKRVIVRSVFKSVSHSLYTNYSPISILSVVDKVMEENILTNASQVMELLLIVKIESKETKANATIFQKHIKRGWMWLVEWCHNRGLIMNGNM